MSERQYALWDGVSISILFQAISNRQQRHIEITQRAIWRLMAQRQGQI